MLQLAVPCHFQTNTNAFVPKILGRKTWHTYIFPLEDLTVLCKGDISTTRGYSEAILHFAWRVSLTDIFAKPLPQKTKTMLPKLTYKEIEESSKQRNYGKNHFCWNLEQKWEHWSDEKGLKYRIIWWKHLWYKKINVSRTWLFSLICIPCHSYSWDIQQCKAAERTELKLYILCLS